MLWQQKPALSLSRFCATCRRLNVSGHAAIAVDDPGGLDEVMITAGPGHIAVLAVQ